jgi:hypothetical protein
VTVPPVGAPWIGSFQRISRAIASRASFDCGTSSNVPTLAMPVDTELKPCACAPTIGWSTPPARPS